MVHRCVSLAFVTPIAVVLISMATRSGVALFAATALQFVGLLAERWYFLPKRVTHRIFTTR